MATFLLLVVGCVGVLVLGAPNGGRDNIVKHVDFLMPKVQPKLADTYLCFPMKMGSKPEYIVGFEPHADMNVAHHILIYECSTPGSSDPVWNCGEMAMKGTNEYKAGPVCGSGTKILYAWAMDAPSLSLPKDVGFKVGGNTDVKYLVLQVHYKDVTKFLPPLNGFDSSGITLKVTETPQPRRAGVYLIGTSGQIEPQKVTYMESACNYNEDFTIHPFAYRTHAHTHGKVSSGYRIRNGQWTEIGRMSPQKPQMFYNGTTPGLVVQKGDVLAARCTMENELDHVIRIGSTQNDEMCNFYVMYYTDDADKTMSSTYCFSQGPPNYYWAYDDKMKNNLDNIPATASVIPGTTKAIKQTATKGIYEDDDAMDNAIDDIAIANIGMGTDRQKLDPDQFERLIEYLQERGPRSYEEEYYYTK